MTGFLLGVASALAVLAVAVSLVLGAAYSVFQGIREGFCSV